MRKVFELEDKTVAVKFPNRTSAPPAARRGGVGNASLPLPLLLRFISSW